jgi:hypothetical protein
MFQESGHSSRLPNIRVAGLLLILVLFVPRACAQEPRAGRGEPQLTSAPDPGEQATALRAQLEVIREYDQKLLATVYWSLGSIAFIAVLLTTYSWYTNFRVYEREREALRSETQLSLKQGLTTAEATLKQQLASAEATLMQQGAAAEDTFRQELATGKAMLNDASKEAAKAVEERLMRSINFLKLEVIDLKIKIGVSEKASNSNLLRAYLEMLTVGLDLEYASAFADAMKHIELLMKGGATIWSHDVPKLHATLNRVGAEFAPQVEIIRQLIPASTEALR